MLCIRNASMRFDETPLFDPISLDIPGGEIMLLMASSGVGKSTLLHWICGTASQQLKATGDIILNGHNLTTLPAERRGIGIIFQDGLLFPHLSVWENLAFGMPRGGSASDRRDKAIEALASVGLAGMEDRDPLTLSGGQKARVALLRSLLAEPAAILLDEPFSGLDGKTREGFASLVIERIRASNLPAILVSHDPRDEIYASMPIVHLEKHA